MHELMIIGGGPAGTAAGVYAARKKLKTALITKEWGGQSVVSPDIQNWIGTPSITGTKLAEDLKNHLLTYADDIVSVTDATCVTTLEKTEEGFTATLENSDTITAANALITSGSHRKRLKVEGASEFENRGLTYCATCDGPLFADKDVAVIGGGNAGFETAAQLLAYAKSVTLLHRGDTFKADPVTVEKVLENEHMTAIKNADTKEIYGEQMVTGLRYTDTQSGEVHELDVAGVFVEIGMVPNTSFVNGLVELDEYNRINIDPWTQKTSTKGIWAAGDCTNIKYHQNNISAGDAVRALEDIYVTLKTT